MERSRKYDEKQLNEESAVRFRVVTDPKEIERLEAEPKVKVYRAMQMVDGNLYPPMAGKINGEWQTPIQMDTWEQSDEHPELVDENGKFKLDKGNGSSPMPVAYNPYLHTSRSPLNDQFSSAWKRPELVTVEVEIPESELTSGYKAEKAKDAVGEIDWKSGSVSGKLAKMGNPRKVILSRYDKPVRVVPNEEVAQRIAEMLKDTDIEIPFNTVTPELRDALVAQGVKIGAPEKGNAGKKSKSAYEEWKKEGEVRFSVEEERELKKVDEEFNKGLSVLNEKNKDSIILFLGKPSKILLDAGVEDKQIKLYGNKVLKKQKEHGFYLEELRSLPSAVAAPIAVFNNYKRKGNRSILTELSTKDGNFLVAIEIGRDGDIDFNIVSSVFGKNNESLEDWLRSGYATYIDEQKVKDFLLHQSAPIAAASAKSSPYSAAKIDEKNNLNKLLGEKLYIRTKNFKKWFGDWENDAENASKVVDENGEPLVVYKRTAGKVNVFDTKFGSFFSNEPIEDLSFGDYVGKYYLNIRKPLELNTSPLAEIDLVKGCKLSLLAKCDYFTTYHLELKDWETVEFKAPEKSFQSLTVLSGSIRLEAGGEEMELAKGETVFLPVGMGDYTLMGEAECLMAEH